MVLSELWLWRTFLVALSELRTWGMLLTALTELSTYSLLMALTELSTCSRVYTEMLDKGIDPIVEVDL